MTDLYAHERAPIDESLFYGDDEPLEVPADIRPATSWARINIADDRYAVPPAPPCWELLYRKKRHALSGPPESAKTMIALILLLTAMRAGATVAIIDFELGPEAIRLLLVELGATLEEIAAIYYVEPETEPGADEIAALVEAGVDLMLIDALAGAYDVSGLDDGKRKDVEKWQNIWSKPLYQRGIATLAIDHVTKSTETRGNFSIGSERKLGGVDIHLGLEVVRPLARGIDGLFKASIKKDRPGFLRADGVREIELRSDPDTHVITWEIRTTGSTSTGDHWQPTFLMERVSAYLEKQTGEPASRNEVEKNCKGKSRDHIRKAIDALVATGYVTEERGARNARMLTLVKPYIAEDDA
jgi:hypothetical protein